MARGGYRPGAGRPKGSVSTKTKTTPSKKSVVSVTCKTPLDYMLAVMNDPFVDETRRDRMAIAAAPFVHPKKGDAGKKEGAAERAQAAGSGKFAASSAPPRLAAANGRKV